VESADALDLSAAYYFDFRPRLLREDDFRVADLFFFAPPVFLFTVCQARFAAVLLLTPLFL
jgi:hypothetical protein